MLCQRLPNDSLHSLWSDLEQTGPAGSESARASLSKSHRQEGSFINKSLLTLGTVIAKLSDGNAVHIPFRDSKLTRLLQVGDLPAANALCRGLLCKQHLLSAMLCVSAAAGCSRVRH